MRRGRPIITPNHRRLALFLATIVLSIRGGAQPIELRDYSVTCDPAAFARILAYFWRDEYIPCRFASAGDTIEGAEIRIRGETSRGYPKKSFKVNLPWGNSFQGRDKLNLISEWTDACFSREFLTYDLFRRAGLTASRAWFVRLFVNGRYLGLYLDVEQVNKPMLRENGLGSDVRIFKAAENGCLLLPGEIEAGLWESETGDSADFRELEALVAWLARVPDADFFFGLGRRFDLDALARAIAANALSGNSSTYYHNYYLAIARGEAGRWIYLPWDVDKTFDYYDGYRDPPYCRSGHQVVGTNELIRRCWLDAGMRERILTHLRGMTDSLFTRDYYSLVADSLTRILHDAVAADTAKQFTLNDFLVILSELPREVGGRGARLRELTAVAPQPFDVEPALITPAGAFFRWGEAGLVGGEPVTYRFEIAHHRLFQSPDTVIANIIQARVILPYLAPDTLYWRVIAFTPSGNYLTTLHQFSPLVVREWAFNPIEAPSRIEGTLRLGAAQGVYRAAQGIEIAPGGLLLLEPGVTIAFAAGMRLFVRGGLEPGAPTPPSIEEGVGGIDVRGDLPSSTRDSVRLVPLDPIAGWGGVVVEEGAAAAFRRTAIRGVIAPDPSFNSPPAEHGGSKGGWAVRALPGSSLTLKSSSVESAGSGAIWVTGGTIVLDSCKAEGTGDLLMVDESPLALVRGSTFIGEKIGDGAGTLARFDRLSEGVLEISGCRFYGGVRAIHLQDVSYGRVVGNWIEDAALAGVAVEGAHAELYLTNSLFLRCGGGLLQAAGVAEVWNNDFVLCAVGVLVSAAGTAVKLRNTVLWRCDVPLWLQNGGRLDIAYSLCDIELPNVGEGMTLGEPQFEDPFNDDFTPEPDSRLIDAGLSDGAPVTDFYGRPRLNTPGQKNKGGGRLKYYDIGAIEYPVGEPTPRAADYRLLSTYPNPTNDRARIRFRIEATGPVRLAVYDVGGRLLAERRYPQLDAGEHSADWGERTGVGELSGGIYFCRLEQPSGVSVWKMAVVK